MHHDAGKTYRMVVRSELNERYAAAFEEVEMKTNGGLTILTGTIIDRPHLYGILDRLCGLGLELLSVECLREGTKDDTANSPQMTKPEHQKVPVRMHTVYFATDRLYMGGNRWTTRG